MQKENPAKENPVTAISDAMPFHLIRGYPLWELTGNISYAEALYLVIKGEMPSENQAKMLDVLLTCGLDAGGLGAAQTLTARLIATANPDDPMAAAAGALLAFGSVTGSPAFTAFFIEKAYDLMKKEKLSAEEAAKRVVEEARKNGERVPGLGHRWYVEGDPRGIRIRDCAERYGFVGERTRLYDCISAEVGQRAHRPMQPNIDGAFAVAALELGLSARLLGPLFALSLLPGIIAHMEEEMSEPERRSIRRLIDNNVGWKYTGHERRGLSKEKIKVPLDKVKKYL